MDWKERQIKFWYGGSYQSALLDSWAPLREALDASDYGALANDYLDLNDVTVESVNFKYRDYAEKHGIYATLRFPFVVEVLVDILAHDKGSRLNKDHIFPILMADGIGPGNPIIGFNRSSVHSKMLSILWPWSYHYDIAMHGLRDDIVLAAKKPVVFFRGSLSGPLHSHLIYSHFRKTSRVEILVSVPKNDKAFDVGLTSIPPDKQNQVEYGDQSSVIESLVRSSVPMTDMFLNKYILCIEGHDIGSQFGAILASHSVPIHPYPFCFNVWYFNGLEPWEHFVPISTDGHDLQEIFDFCESHPALMQQISENGRMHMMRMLDRTELSAVKEGVVELWNMTR